MGSTGARTLPDVGEVLAPLLARVAREEWPLFIALAERLAAERYRGWAGGPELREHASALRACAERENEIATRVESLDADAARIQERLRAEHPDLEAINAAVFAGRPIGDQLQIQARGERLGAATWRGLAKSEADPARAAVLRACAELEEASAVVLERILAVPIA